jgi:hypothetical protein
MAIVPVLKAYERHISAAAMVGGFVIDNFAFGRLDHPATQAVMIAYLVAAASSILLLHYQGERAENNRQTFRWGSIVSGITQFAFGGLWSAFLIFYSRSSVIATAWPFLLILVFIFLGNEIFREYRSRLVFTAILLSFALFSYCTFVVPIFTGTIDRRTFLISEGLAATIFAVFVVLLALLARTRIRRDIKKILVTKIQPWYQKLNRPSTYDLTAGQQLYAYSAVFAPIHLSTQIVHEWEWYDEAASSWRTETVVAFPVSGGRELGYRGYSFKSNLRPGSWRVDVETSEGRVIERTNFEVRTAKSRQTTRTP